MAARTAPARLAPPRSPAPPAREEEARGWGEAAAAILRWGRPGAGPRPGARGAVPAAGPRRGEATPRPRPAAGTQPPLPPPLLRNGNGPPGNPSERWAPLEAGPSSRSQREALGARLSPPPGIVHLCTTPVRTHRRKALREQAECSFITSRSGLLKISRSTLLPAAVPNGKPLPWANRTSASCRRLPPVPSWHW